MLDQFGTLAVTDLEDGHILTLSKPDGTSVRILVDPISWAWVAAKLAEAAVGFLVEAALKDLFGGGKADLQSLIKSFIAAVEAIINQAIADDRRREYESNLSALGDTLGYYLNDKRPQLLDNIIISAANVRSQLFSLGLPAIGAFAVAGSLEMAVLQQAYVANRTRGGRANVAACAERRIKDAEAYPPMLKASVSARYSEVIETYIPSSPGGGSGSVIYGYYDRRTNQWVFQNFWDRGPVEAHRSAKIASEYVELEKQLIVPLLSVVQKWDAVKSRASHPSPTFEEVGL